MRWTALHPGGSIRFRFELEESHESGRHDWIRYREIGVYAEWRSNAADLAVAKPLGRTLPLLHVVRDHSRGFHCGVAELRVTGNFTLHTLAFGMEELA